MSYWNEYPRYVSVGERRAQARMQMNRLRKKGKDIHPVEIEGRTIARSFWGKGWCGHLESFSDYENRLPRGRNYVRNGSVCHLEVRAGRIEAIVSGTHLYNVSISIEKLKTTKWKSIKKKCSGQIGSMLELLKGKLSGQVMAIVTDRDHGLFPLPGEIGLDCDCPDWAVMCKHVAAVLYGVGNRLDNRPEMLFLLRGVDAQELISAGIALPTAEASAAGDTIAEEQLGDIFGIDLESDGGTQPAGKAKKMKRRSRPDKKSKKPRVAKGRKTTPRAVRPKKTKPTDTTRARAKSSGPAPPKIRPTGKSIARLRKQLGLSAAHFARQLGVTAATVYRWETASGGLKLQERPLKALASLQQRTPKRQLPRS